MKIERKQWMKIHSYVSAFFLPLAVIFILTGVLYLFGLHSTMERQKVDFQVERSLMKDPAALTDAVKKTLEENDLSMPGGQAKRIRNGYAWGKMTGVSVQLFPDRKSGEFRLFVNKAGIYDKLILAHKGKVGTVFIIFSVLFSISLLVTYFSGVFIAFKNKANRKNTVAVIAIGIVVTVILLFISV